MTGTQNKTLLAIDQGTTSSRAILFSTSGEIICTSQKELPQIYPQSGWVEHDPEIIWQDTLTACRDVLGRNPEATKSCAGIGITNQRETTIVWDRKTGKPVYNAIVWQDRRTAEFCKTLKADGHEDSFTAKTGLLLDPYFSCTKLRWILDNVEGVRTKAEDGELAFGTIDSYLLWHLTEGRAHATDATNAARTGLFNIRSQQWDEELLTLFDIPASLLPEVKDNAADFGKTHLLTEDRRTLPIAGMAGDQHAALIGQACFEKGNIKSTYGTGCFMLMNIGEEMKRSQNRLLTTPAYRLNGHTTYAIEGSIFIAGAAIQWLRDQLAIIEQANETEQIAGSVHDTNGVYFIPAFTGLGAPYWNPDARAAIIGIGRESTKAHIVRAALEAQAYQTQDLLTAMQDDTGVTPTTLKVDGGLVNNDFVCTFLADILNIPVALPAITETTALGAAYLAGLQLGIYKDLDDIARHWSLKKTYTPTMKNDQRDTLYAGWKKALSGVLHTYN